MSSLAPAFEVNGLAADGLDDAKPTQVSWKEYRNLRHNVLPIRPLGSHVPAHGFKSPRDVPSDRGLLADPNLPNLLGLGVQRIDLTPSIGTQLTGLQLSQLTDVQKDELALLAAHRGVVFFRDQDITAEQQRALFDYYGLPELPGDNPEDGKKSATNTIQEQEQDYRKTYIHFKWPFADFHADSSFEINPPSFSLLRVDEPPPTGGDTNWISGYGTFESLSPTLQKFVEGLSAWHSAGHVYDSVLNHWSGHPPTRPRETLHPVVRTHPVTGYKSLNLNSGFVDRIDGLNRYESDKILELLFTHIHTAIDHSVRWRWEKNSVALWDNRATTHRATHDYAPIHRHGVRVTIIGEIPVLKKDSRARREVEKELRNQPNLPAVYNENLRKGKYLTETKPVF
ncbi:hypothetical protein BGW36DRAFT_358819 [Talaromyces proteolyticus]|uniref:TauD/TfdA-like domain-containing protein n=1 Tax=Talaromyces proteolyticus TaxID=1131652 RepID=A0AAD4KQP2_9EURO|nr:uncharacterized protein BGW36DRAFT_358819 [Talaromyces proteolyticus]KAH8697003.1 hypothetical protein BGW36DRAFT_358819 [Talaromyces proteolyticus]